MASSKRAADFSPDKKDLNPIEIASRDEIAALQLRRMKWSLRHAYENVPHYKKSFDAAGVHPDDLKDLSDLRKFPLTAKDDLRANYPYGMFAVPMDKVVRIHASSGTTGKPTVVGYTKLDIRTWADVCARSIYASGGRAGHEDPQCLRLRAVHRRARRALRRREARLRHDPGLRRHDRAPGQADRRFRARHHHGDAELHAGDPR